MKIQTQKYKLLIKYIILVYLFFNFIFVLYSASNTLIKIGTTDLTVYFDPYKYNKSTTLSINQHIFESLISIDNTGKVIPSLSSGWINLDNKTWVFNLRKGVYFTDGSQLTADDVIYSFERVKLDITSNIKQNFGVNLAFSKIEKLNDYSIKIITENIFPTFLLRLRNCAILPKKYIEENGFEYFLKNPIGTGPYMNPTIINNGDTKTITLTRNEKYWGKKPYFKNVEFIITTDENLLKYIQNQEIDCVVWLKTDQYFKLKDNKNYTNLSIPGLRTNFLILNCNQDSKQDVNLSFNPLANEKVRKALYYSLNMNEIVKTIFHDTVTYANQLVSPNIVGFNSNLPYQKQDINYAKQLLKEVNLFNGFNLDLVYSEKDLIFDKIALKIKEYFNNINIKLNLIKSKENEIGKIRKEGSFSIIPYSLSSGTGDALFVLSTLIHSKNDNWGSYNFSGFYDRSIDQLIEKASEEFDEQKRIILYQKIMELTMDKLPFIPLYWPNVLAIVKSKLRWSIRPDERVYAFDMSY